MRLNALAALPLLLSMPAHGQEADQPATPGSVIAEAAPEEWIAIPPEDLLVMELAPDASGNARRVVIQLMPPPFSQPWVENIRTLARAHWWDGTSVNRVQDNYVTQWGDVTEAKPLPEGVETPYSSWDYEPGEFNVYEVAIDDFSEAMRANLAAVFERIESRGPGDPVGIANLEDGNITLEDMTYSLFAAFEGGFPYSYRLEQYFASSAAPIHCYGYVGVGRNVAPDTGTGAELYTIIGQPQRHMDRNLAVVGRVIEGMEHLSSLPRGSGELGFYTEEEAQLRTPILSVRLGGELVSASNSNAVGQQEDMPKFEYLDTTSESFARYVNVRANRKDDFYTVPAGGVDICSVQVPVRRAGE